MTDGFSPSAYALAIMRQVYQDCDEHPGLTLSALIYAACAAGHMIDRTPEQMTELLSGTYPVAGAHIRNITGEQQGPNQ